MMRVTIALIASVAIHIALLTAGPATPQPLQPAPPPVSIVEAPPVMEPEPAPPVPPIDADPVAAGVNGFLTSGVVNGSRSMTFDPKGERLYVSLSTGEIDVFDIDSSGALTNLRTAIVLPIGSAALHVVGTFE